VEHGLRRHCAGQRAARRAPARDRPNQARIEGEVRFLRAFYYYLLMDLYGGVPIATTLELQARARATRDSTFRFIESELLAARRRCR